MPALNPHAARFVGLITCLFRFICHKLMMSDTPRWAACAPVPQSRSRAAEAELTIVATQADNELFFAVSGERADDVESGELYLSFTLEYSSPPSTYLGSYDADTEGDDTATAQVFETGALDGADGSRADVVAAIQVADQFGNGVAISVNDIPASPTVEVPLPVRSHA